MKLNFSSPLAYKFYSTIGLQKSFSTSTPADRIREQLELLADRISAAMISFPKPTSNKNNTQ